MTREEEIRRIAYGLWEAEGHTEDRDLEHWSKAEEIWQEREARQSLEKPPKAEPATGQGESPLEPTKATRSRPRPRTSRPRQ
ncbi:MAG: DUF2934 domain-containing protein [Chloroflexi bacterium]|nr:DUF2934 domain-containing protein [Chloroflexota bacterium]